MTLQQKIHTKKFLKKTSGGRGWSRWNFADIFEKLETRISGLSYGVVCVILGLAIFVGLRLVTDRQTNGHDDSIYRASIASCGPNGPDDLNHADLRVVCRPKANTWYSLSVYKFGNSRFSRSRYVKEDTKRNNGVVRVTQGHWKCHHSMQRFDRTRTTDEHTDTRYHSIYRASIVPCGKKTAYKKQILQEENQASS